jgi:hypothetical protein
MINAVSNSPTPRCHTGSQTIGQSVKSRAITLTVAGSPMAKKRVMVVGETYGNERGGVPIAKAIAKSKAPSGVALRGLLSQPGRCRAQRPGNARRVDLNRNFPGWKRNGRLGFLYYPRSPRAFRPGVQGHVHRYQQDQADRLRHPPPAPRTNGHLRRAFEPGESMTKTDPSWTWPK